MLHKNLIQICSSVKTPAQMQLSWFNKNTSGGFVSKYPEMCQLRAAWRDGRWNLEGTAMPVVSLHGFVGQRGRFISSSAEFSQNNPARVCPVQAGSWLLQGMSVLGARHSSSTLPCACWHVWLWVSSCVSVKFPVSAGQSTSWAGAENTNSFTGRVAACSCFSSGETPILTKVFFLFTTMALRVCAAAWIPVEDAEEPVPPVSMETPAGGGGCGTAGEEQGEAK